MRLSGPIFGIAVFAALLYSKHCCLWERDVAQLVRYGEAGRLERYLEGGANPNRVVEGSSLLEIATGPKGGLDKLRVLLAAGADPNRSSDGYTPLMNAASWGRLDACKLLISHGADPMQARADGRTAIDVARGKTYRDDIAAYLLSLAR